MLSQPRRQRGDAAQLGQPRRCAATASKPAEASTPRRARPQAGIARPQRFIRPPSRHAASSAATATAAVPQ